MRDKNLNGIIINEKRAIQVCEKVISTIKEKKYLFSNPKIFEYMNPESKLLTAINSNKKEDKEKKALWLFMFLHGDKRIKSSKYYSQLRDFYLDNPNFFNLENFMKKFGRKKADFYIENQNLIVEYHPIPEKHQEIKKYKDNKDYEKKRKKELEKGGFVGKLVCLFSITDFYKKLPQLGIEKNGNYILKKFMK